MGFANLQRCRNEPGAEAADLPPCRGDARPFDKIRTEGAKDLGLAENNQPKEASMAEVKTGKGVLVELKLPLSSKRLDVMMEDRPTTTGKQT